MVNSHVLADFQRVLVYLDLNLDLNPQQNYSLSDLHVVQSVFIMVLKHLFISQNNKDIFMVIAVCK